MPLPAIIALAAQLLPFAAAVPEVVSAFKRGDTIAVAEKVITTAAQVTGATDPETAVTRILGDPALQAQFQQALIAERVEYARLESAERIAQIELNKVDAVSEKIMQYGWRPFIGWVCGVAFAYAGVVEPMARFVAQVFFGYSGAFPQLDTMLTMQVLMGLLGLAGMRTYEKQKKNGAAKRR